MRDENPLAMEQSVVCAIWKPISACCAAPVTNVQHGGEKKISENLAVGVHGIKSTFMESKRKYNQRHMAEDGVSVLQPISHYDIDDDCRYLVPFLKNDKYGLINHNYEVIVPAIYDKIVDVCTTQDDFIRVANMDYYAYERRNSHPEIYTRYKYGVINTNWEIVIPVEYGGIIKGDDIFILRAAYGYQYKGKHAIVDLN